MLCFAVRNVLCILELCLNNITIYFFIKINKTKEIYVFLFLIKLNVKEIVFNLDILNQLTFIVT